MRTTLVIGGAGFIGPTVVRGIIQRTVDRVVAMNKLTCVDNLISLAPVARNVRFAFKQVDICDRNELDRIFRQHQPDTVMHLTAESHVDRSINGSAASIETNILGVYTLLGVTRSWQNTLATEKKSVFCFHHISTDEMCDGLYGSGNLFTETTSYASSSPYSASKAGSNYLVCVWLRTYGLPTLIIDRSNNYGPYHFPEKLIPLTTLNVLAGKPLPVYGNGQQICNWLYVEDHARTLYLVTTRGELGEAYNIDGHNECKNIEVVETIHQLLEGLAPRKPRNVVHHHDLITFVADHPGHDLCYAIDASKIAHELGWTSAEAFISGMRKTVV